MIDIRLAWDHPVRPSHRRTEHVLFIGLTPQPGAPQLPANLCIALDCSASMEGPKLQQALNACRLAYESLGPNDLLSLLAYSSRVHVRFAPKLRSELPASVLEEHLAAIGAQGLTRTELAIDGAAEVLRPGMSPERVTLVILITDGHPTDSDGQNRPVSDYATFYDQVENLAAQGITTWTVGLGSARHYNSQFLTELADRGQGRFCYAPEVDELAKLLQQEIHSARSTIVKGLEVALAPRSVGVQLKKFCRITPEYRPLDVPPADPTGAWRLAAGSLESPTVGAETGFLAQMQLEGVFGMATGEQPVVAVTVSWQSPTGSRVIATEAVAQLKYTAIVHDQRECNRDVDDLRRRWEIILCQEEASRTDSRTRATRMLATVVDGAEQLGLPEIREQAKRQMDQLVQNGHVDADAVTLTRQLLRATRSEPNPQEATAAPSLGVGFGGGAPLHPSPPRPKAADEPPSEDRRRLEVVQGNGHGE